VPDLPPLIGVGDGPGLQGRHVGDGPIQGGIVQVGVGEPHAPEVEAQAQGVVVKAQHLRSSVA
jgi:hypothetical protein